MAKVDGKGFAGRDAALPGNHFGKGLAFEVAAENGQAIGERRAQGRVLAGEEADRLDEAGHADEGKALAAPGEALEHLGELHRIVAGFGPLAHRRDRGREAVRKLAGLVGGGRHVDHAVDVSPA